MWCNILDDWDYCTPSNPCKASKKSNHCCNKWSDKIGHNLKSLMKIMRFASRRGNSGFTLKSILPNPTDKLFYPIKGSFVFYVEQISPVFDPPSPLVEKCRNLRETPLKTM